MNHDGLERHQEVLLNTPLGTQADRTTGVPFIDGINGALRDLRPILQLKVHFRPTDHLAPQGLTYLLDHPHAGTFEPTRVNHRHDVHTRRFH